MDKIPTYKYRLDSGFVLSAVSMVDEPAVEHNAEYFSKRENFAVQDGNVIGCAVLCGVPIPRVDGMGNLYNVVFDREVCDNLVQQILRKGLPLTLDHAEMSPVDATLTGVFQVSKHVKFQDVPDGSIIISYKANPELIGALKERGGFSIELFFNELEPFSKVDSVIEFVNGL